MRTWLDDFTSPCEHNGFIHRKETSVRIGTQIFATPPVDDARRALDGSFAAFCLDPASSAVLSFVAGALARGEAPLLLGPTSSAKSWGAALAGHLLGLPVSRIALSAGTETADLVGRFVPSPAGHWAWSDGPVTTAVRPDGPGGLVILDELNLPSAATIERTNCLLDSPRWLSLAESTGETYGLASGAPVHARFRLAATANPASYAAREPLSAAFVSRWTPLRVEAPAEAEFAAQLTFHLLGLQPGWGDAAATEHEPPLEGHMRELSWATTLIERLALFTAGMDAAARPGSDGLPAKLGGPGEPVVFGRRTLARLAGDLAAADPANVPEVLVQSLERLYFAPLTEAERLIASRLVEAAALRRADLDALASTAPLPTPAAGPGLPAPAVGPAAVLVHLATGRLTAPLRSQLASFHGSSRLPEDADAPWVLAIREELEEAEAVACSVSALGAPAEVRVLRDLGAAGLRWDPTTATRIAAVSGALLSATPLTLPGARAAARSGLLEGLSEGTLTRVSAALTGLGISAERLPAPDRGVPYLRVANVSRTGPQVRAVVALLGCSKAEAERQIDDGRLLVGAPRAVLRAAAAFLAQRRLGLSPELVQ